MGLISNFVDLFITRHTNGSWWIGGNSAKKANAHNMELFKSVYALNACINLRAMYACKFKWGVKVSDTEIDYEHPLLDIIKNPNPYQGTVDLINQWCIYKNVHGWVYQKPFKTSISGVKALYNLNPTKINFNSNKNKPLLIWKEQDKNDLKNDSFVYDDNGNLRTYNFKDIIPFYDVSNGLSDDYQGMFTSPSKVQAVLDSISIIDIALDGENVAWQSIGRESLSAEGQKANDPNSFISPYKSISENDRNDVDSKLNNKAYLKSKRLRTFTPSVPVVHQDLSLKPKDYGFIESLDKHESIIARAFNIPLELYQSYKTGATFENQQTAIVKLIDDIKETDIKDLEESWTASFGDPNTPFVATANHLRVLQKEEDKKADKALKISQALANLQRAGIPDGMEFLSGLGIDLNE